MWNVMKPLRPHMSQELEGQHPEQHDSPFTNDSPNTMHSVCGVLVPKRSCFSNLGKDVASASPEAIPLKEHKSQKWQKETVSSPSPSLHGIASPKIDTDDTRRWITPVPLPQCA